MEKFSRFSLGVRKNVSVPAALKGKNISLSK